MGGGIGDDEADRDGAIARAARWERMRSAAARYRDPWGNRIDEGIQAAVAALWTIDIPTRWSCEGHDWGLRAPWITVALSRDWDRADLDSRRARIAPIHDRLQELLDRYRSEHEPIVAETELHLREEPTRVEGRLVWDCAYQLRSVGVYSGSAFTEEPGALGLLHGELDRFVAFLHQASLAG